MLGTGNAIGQTALHAAPKVSRRAFDTLAAPYALFSTARLLTGYAGAFARWRRASDGDQQDLWIDGQSVRLGGGEPVSAWLGASDATYATWYDQSGNGRHAAQATVAAQARAALAGVVDVGPNGLPVLVFSGGQYLDIQNSAGFSQNQAALTSAAVSRATGVSTQAIMSNCIAGSAASSRTFFGYSSATSPTMQTRTTDAGTFATQAGAAVASGAWTRLIGRGRCAAGAVDISVNGTTATNAALAPAQNSPNTVSAANVRIGATTFGSAYLTGAISTFALAQAAPDLAAYDAALARVMP